MTVHVGDCRAVLPTLPPDSCHACVTDPPYELGFMGRAWDSSGVAYDVDMWAEVLRVLKPGAYLLAFGGTRTYHRLACAIEDAGFEIRDSIAAWLYGSGFPKSLDVGKAIDKAAGAERQVVGEKRSPGGVLYSALHGPRSGRTGGGIMGEACEVPRSSELLTAPATEDAARWEGWGTALKPAWEPIIVARKPLAGTVAANVLAHGVGGLNIDGCRVAHGADVDLSREQRQHAPTAIFGSGDAGHVQPLYSPQGRWPANTVLAHHPDCGDDCHPDCWVRQLDQQSGVSKSPPVGSVSRTKPRHSTSMAGGFNHDPDGMANGYGDAGGASRFFPTFRYEAKAPTRERPKVDGVAHATVKPLALIRWLVRLVTPPGGLVLDPFLGSGTTCDACDAEGFTWEGIERDPDHASLIAARLAQPLQHGLGF